MASLARTSPLARYWQSGSPAAFIAPAVSVSERPFLAKRLLRGAAGLWGERLRARCGLDLPPVNGATATAGLECLGLRPDEWLVMAAEGSSTAALDALASPADSAGTVIDVTDRHACLEVRGERAAALLNCGCSIDFHERVFAAGRCCQTRIEEVPVIVYRPDESSCFNVMPERALADYLWRWFLAAAREFSGSGP